MAPSFTDNEDELLIEHIQNHRAIFDMENKDYKNLMIKENIWKEIAKVVGKYSKDCKLRWKSIRDHYLKIKKGQKLGKTGSAASEKRIKWNLYYHLSFLESTKRERSSENTCTVGDQGIDSGVPTDSPGTQYDTDEYPQDEDSYSDNIQLESGTSKQKDGFVGIQSPAGSCLDTNESSSSATPSSQGRSRQKKDAKTDILEMIDRRAKERAGVLRELIEKKKEEEDDIDAFMRSIALTVKKLTPEKVARAKASILAIVTELQFSTSVTGQPQNTHSDWQLYNMDTHLVNN